MFCFFSKIMLSDCFFPKIMGVLVSKDILGGSGLECETNPLANLMFLKRRNVLSLSKARTVVLYYRSSSFEPCALQAPTLYCTKTFGPYTVVSKFLTHTYSFIISFITSTRTASNNLLVRLTQIRSYDILLFRCLWLRNLWTRL